MSMSRRDLYAMGEPFGDSATQHKVGGGRIYGGGGSGGGGGNQTSTTVQDVPDWAKPYAKEGLGKAAALTDTNQNPYQQYDQSRQAGFTGLQNHAFTGAQNMGPSAAMGTAANMAGTAGLGALNAGANFNPYQAQNQFSSPPSYQTGQFNPNQVQGGGYNAPSMDTAQTGFNPQLQNYQMGPAQQVSTQSFNQSGTAQDYMNPYMQNVVDIQKREAQRTADIAGTQRGAQAAKAGAFGGSRQAIIDAEANRNLSQQLGDIQATGSQAAFQNAQQQFNAEQAAGLQAQQSNQQAGITMGGQNLSANLATQQLGTQTGLQSSLANLSAEQQANVQNQASQLQTQGLNAQQAMQAALSNQQYGLESQKLGEQSRQFGSGQNMTAAQLQAQYGLSGQQLAEQSRQYGAGLGMQGFQTALTGAGQLSNIGQQTFGQQMDINKLQQQYGTQQQAFDQQGKDNNYQDFLNQQRYPYQQLEFMNSMLRGTPMGTVQSMYAPPPSQLSQVAGLGATAYGISRMAEGGAVKGYAVGGGITGLLNDSQLQQRTQMPTVSTLGRMAAQDEMQDRAQMRSGSAQQAPQDGQPSVADEYLMSRGVASLPAGEMDFAGGGILAFAEGGSPRNATDGRGKPLDARAQALLQQAEGDREGFMEVVKKLGAAGYDIATLLPRGAAGAIDSTLIRGARAVTGLDIPYLGSVIDTDSMTPMMDEVRRGQNEPNEDQQRRAELGAQGVAEEQANPYNDSQRFANQAVGNVAGVTNRSLTGGQDAPPADTGGTAGQGGAGIGAPRATGLAELKAMYAADPAAAQKYIDQMDLANAANEDVARQGIANVKRDQTEMGDYGTERESKLKDQEAGLAGLEKRNQSMAFIDAGLAIMAGNSANAFENIGKGALVGTKAYKEGMDKIDTKRTKLDEAFMNLYDIRRGEKVANKKDLRAAENAFEMAKAQSEKTMADVTGKLYDGSQAAAKAAVDAHLRATENQLARDATIEAARIAAAAKGETKEMTPAQIVSAKQTAIAQVDKTIAANVSLQQQVQKDPTIRTRMLEAALREAGVPTGGQSGAGGSKLRFDAQGNLIS